MAGKIIPLSRIIIIEREEENKIPEAVKCSYCNTVYNINNGSGSCQICGGTVNSKSSEAEYLIGRIYDTTVNPDFKPHKVVNSDMLIF